MTIAEVPEQTEDAINPLRAALAGYFGELDDSEYAEIAAHSVWVEYGGGEAIFEQGGEGDCLYIVVSGRLRATHVSAEGKPQLLGDIVAGETVGEMAILSDDRRSATVTAVRDSVVIRIPSASMQKLFLRSPHLLLKISRLIVARVRRAPQTDRRDDHVGTIALIPLGGRLDTDAIARQLMRMLPANGRVLVLDSREIEARSHIPGAALAEKSDPVFYRNVTAWLDQAESTHDYVVYVGHRENDAWTQRCVRQADRVLLLGDARDASAPTPFEREVVLPLAGRHMDNVLLAMFHPPATRQPKGTAPWVAARPWIHEVVHVRQDDAAHMGRLARIISGNATGLVIGSGGARGLAAVGVFRALREAGIPVDRVGGCSIGAVMAAAIGMDWTPDELEHYTASAFGSNPTSLGDLSLLPILSLFRGRRLARLLHSTFSREMQIEDLWLNTFCITSDMSASCECVHTRGPLARTVKASAALPAIFPAVRLGDGLHVDGAFMNALPIDVMGRTGVDRIVAIDFSTKRDNRMAFAEFPSTKAYLYDRLFRRGRARRYRVPTLVSSVIQSSLLASSAKDDRVRKEADLLFNPDVRNYDLMEWASYRELFELGYRHGKEVLSADATLAPRHAAHGAAAAQA